MEQRPSVAMMKCKCGKLMSEEQFSLHFQQCPEFKNSFRQFDSKLGEVLKTYSEPKENLPIISFLLKQYITVIDKKISAMGSSLIGNMQQSQNYQQQPRPMQQQQQQQQPMYQPPQVNNPQPMPYSQQKPLSINQEKLQQEINNPYQNQNQHQDYDIPCCQICSNPDINYTECFHPICNGCIKALAEKDFPNMRCTLCQTPISEDYKRAVLGREKYDELDKRSLNNLIGHLLECPNCHEKNQFESGDYDYNIKDDQNKLISREAAEDYAKNRCRCASCQTIFCAQCNTIPYHVGKTCDQYSKFIVSVRCKYDDVMITAQNKGPANNVCNNAECKERYELSCKKKLPCGHTCYGCHNDSKCPPCLNETCPQFKNIFDQNADSYCNICFTEGLGNAPVVLLSCNHYVHFKCIETRLKTKWINPKITFNHCLCPSCNNWFDCFNNNFIQGMIDENKQLYKEISEMSLKRLKHEDLDKDPKLTDPNSRWYGKTLEYALNRLSYYMCYECKKPYFAGRRECGDGPGVNNDNPNINYDPTHLICGKHGNIAGVAGETECKLHGKEFIEYKCRFCCKIASWFCWGTTHFCEDCHTRQCKADYVSKYPKDKLPKCDSKCELRVKHPPNGEEFALGCSVCRNAQANVKDF